MTAQLKWSKIDAELWGKYTVVSRDDAGAAIQATANYFESGEMPASISPVAQRLFVAGQVLIDNCRADYEAMSARNTENSHKGAGRPRKTKVKNQVDFKPLSAGLQDDSEPLTEIEGETEKEVEGEEKTEKNTLLLLQSGGKGGVGGHGCQDGNQRSLHAEQCQNEQSADFEERRRDSIAKLQEHIKKEVKK
ncbi:MAG: hypothetical protein IJG45_00960 [Oscillospiraceae bacterium]|nr:hypothetical protein [Oscillospiraceae bacterium]